MPKIGKPYHHPQPSRSESENSTPSQIYAENLDDFITPEQRHSLNSNNLHALEIANDQALAIAIQASESEVMPLPTADSAAERLQSQFDISKKLRAWLDKHDYQVISNSGKNNNCLLISLLQHATGDYRSEHHEKAAHYKSILEKESNFHIGRLDPLYFDTHLIANLIHRIGKDHGREMSVNFCFADADGNYAEHIVGSGNNTVMVFDQGGHYEAVLPPSHAIPP